MTIWNQASHKSRTYRTPRPYKPVGPVGPLNNEHQRLVDMNKVGWTSQRFMRPGYISDLKACRCGYIVCSKTGPCAPKDPEYISRLKTPRLTEPGSITKRLLERQNRSAAVETYQKLHKEMSVLAPNSWFFTIPAEQAIEAIAEHISVYGDAFNSAESKRLLAFALRQLTPLEATCSACGRMGTQHAGRVCADMESCEKHSEKYRKASHVTYG